MSSVSDKTVAFSVMGPDERSTISMKVEREGTEDGELKDASLRGGRVDESQTKRGGPFEGARGLFIARLRGRRDS